jgi:hypothetical protein
LKGIILIVFLLLATAAAQPFEGNGIEVDLWKGDVLDFNISSFHPESGTFAADGLTASKWFDLSEGTDYSASIKVDGVEMDTSLKIKPKRS